MGTFTIFDAATEAFDNSPESYEGGSDSSPDYTTTSDTRNFAGVGVVVGERQVSGVTERLAIKTEYLYQYSDGAPEGTGLYITELVYSEGGKVVTHWKDLLMTESSFQLYGGSALLYEYLFRYDDTIYGSSKAEKIYGYEGDDVLYGGAGNDILDGGKGYDRLYGEAGDDTLKASSTVNALKGNYFSGGSGIDTVVLAGKAFDYSISKSPSGDISLTWETGFKVATVTTDTEFIQFNDIKISTSDLTYVGGVQNRLTSSPNAVHRFYNNRDKAFFYTSSKDEKDYVINNSNYDQPDNSEWPYVYQGSTFEVASSYSGQVPLFRFYNTETGHHFFTVNPDERDLVLSKSNSGEWPFNYEGIAFNVYAGDPNPSFSGQEIPVHRFYSPSLDRHFYTGSEAEANEIQLTGQWNYEGIGFWGEVV